MLSDKEMYDRMKNGWRAGRPFTVCGNGSLPAHSRVSQAWLPGVVEKYGIESVNDAGAGDMKYADGVAWNVVYRPFDLIARLPDVAPIDITTEVMPKADAILCRMVLNHLDDDRIDMALEKFRESGAKYLIATQFNGENLPQRSRQFCRLDLRGRLGPYLDATHDGHEKECRLAIWGI